MISGPPTELFTRRHRRYAFFCTISGRITSSCEVDSTVANSFAHVDDRRMVLILHKFYRTMSTVAAQAYLGLIRFRQYCHSSEHWQEAYNYVALTDLYYAVFVTSVYSVTTLSI